MTGLAFRKVTQAAVWHYTNGYFANIPDTPGSHGSYTIYHLLVGNDLPIPNHIQLKIYHPNDPNYQNLVGFVLYDPLTVTMTDEVKIDPVTPSVPSTPTISHASQPKATYVRAANGIQTGVSQSFASYFVVSVIALFGFAAILKNKFCKRKRILPRTRFSFLDFLI